MAGQTLYVGPLPVSATNKRLEEIFSDIGPVKQCFVVKNKGTDKCLGYGFVTFSMLDDAQRALKEVKDYDGQKLNLSVAKKKFKDKKKKPGLFSFIENEQKAKKVVKARLIIRNLSFKCTEDELKETFGKFGTVVDAYIPLKPDGKMRGFGFVLFKEMSGAAKALEAMNLKEIKGRQVAVDWALPKDKYIATQQTSNAGKKKEEEKVSDSESDAEDEDEQPQTSVASKPAQQPVDESSSDEDDGEEESSEDGEIEEDEESRDEDDEDAGHEDDEDEGDGDVDDDDDDDEKSLGSDDEDDEMDESGTVNLSFDTDEDGLEEVLLQYGELNYVKVVLHPDTEHSKGCAFAQFRTKEAADKFLAAANDEAENGGVRVDGRKLFVVAAVSKEDAVKLKVDKKKIETGSRNLYLAREGLIRAGTQAAEGVSEADMTKRTRFEELKRAKLKDINVFVSKNRLCVHNLPKSVDNKKLRALCLQASKRAKGVHIIECRVMYDRKPEKGQVMGQSLGYGFVAFREHEDALSVLRHLNNNPKIFGSEKRPIVEFSLEDSRKLKIKELREQRNKVCMEMHKKVYLERETLIHFLFLSGFSGVSEKPKHNSGFVTKPDVEYIDLENGKKRRKVLPLPSHRGPKNRMRDKGKQQAPPAKKQRPRSVRNDRQRRQMEKPTQPRNQVGLINAFLFL
uniref:RNA-binding protein 28 n=1 Tax=Gouania willdenowi TaxID=441366 RepID=A0A8C5GZG8_GOUWI